MQQEKLDPQTIEAEGQRLFAQKQYKEAAERFALAQRAFAETGHELKATEMLNNVGVVYRRAGKHKEAANALEEARQTFARLGDQRRQAQALGNLGGLYRASGQIEKAARHFKDALPLFHQLGDSQAESVTWRALSTVRLRQRRWLEAVLAYDSSLTCLKRLSLGQRLFHLLLGWLLHLLSGAR